MSMYKRPELDLVNPPGQIVNDITLGDYIARKTRQDALNQVNQERKLTFDEWYFKERPYAMALHQVQEARLIWNAAQENK